MSATISGHFHFKYGRPDPHLDPALRRTKGVSATLISTRIPFLAFAARCTSSFPFAFEPMCFNKVEELLPVL